MYVESSLKFLGIVILLNTNIESTADRFEDFADTK